MKTKLTIIVLVLQVLTLNICRAQWQKVSNGLDGLAGLVKSIAASETILFAATLVGVYLSTDNGEHWTAVSRVCDDNRILSITTGGRNIFAGTVGEGIFLSNNNGASWTPVNNGLNHFR